MTLPDQLLNKLVCPRCKGEALQIAASAQQLECIHCQSRFPVNDGVPVLLIDEAENVK
jgi:hypothetical protein